MGNIIKKQSPAPTGDLPTDHTQMKSNQPTNTSSAAILTPDREQLNDFYTNLFCNSSNGYVNLRGFDSTNKPAATSNWKAVDVTKADDVINAAYSLSELIANYPNPAVFCPPIATFKTQYKAGEADICEGIVLSVDIDKGNPQNQVGILTDILGTPTVIAESGGSITDEETGEILPKLHAHWRLSEPTTTPEQHKQLKHARDLANRIIGGDTSATPLCHPLRWAGSWHTKSTPILCKIAELNQDAQIHLNDAIAELEMVASQLPEIEQVSTTNNSKKNDPAVYVECADNIRSGINLHESTVRLSAKRASSGMGEADIIEELEALLNASEAPRDERWQQRFDDIPRTARSAMQFYRKSYDENEVAKMFTKLASTQPETGWQIIPFNQSVDPDLSQDALALELSKAGYNNNARYVAKWGKWLFWSGQHWKVDDRMLHMTTTREFLRIKSQGLLKWANKKVLKMDNKTAAEKLLSWAKTQAKALRQASNVAAVESMAQSNGDLVATVEQFDSDLMLLGTPNGTVNLKTGELMPAQRNHWITKCCSTTPAEIGTPAPIWTTFLERIFDGDKALIKFMQRAAGYALTGQTTEHKLLFMYGTGSNGKSVFLNTLFGIMGEYAKRAAAQTFLKSGAEQHPTDVAGLQGARLVAGSELPAGKAWNEAIIKDLTGGDIITARFMRQDYFDFMPQFTLFIAGNHQPSFSGIDGAIRRRVVLVPFTQTISAEERDPDLSTKLKAEWPAIMRWAIDGALEWQRIGLVVPDAVSAASAEYMEDEDTLSDFFSENIAEVPFGKISNPEMFERFNDWQKSCGARTLWTTRAITIALKERGLKQIKSNGKYWNGVSLKPRPKHYPFKFERFSD